MSKIGTKYIASVGQHSRFLDADGIKVVGNKAKSPRQDSQKWVIAQVPVSTDPKVPREDKYERFTIYNSSAGKYLDYDGTKAILTDAPTRWEIAHVDDDHYKIVVDRSGRACSLGSDADDAPVTVKQFMGPDEEWTLEAIVDPTPVPPPTDVTGILSVAFDNTAIALIFGDALHSDQPDDCVEAWFISARNSGYVIKQSDPNVWEPYLGVVNGALKTTKSEFIWNITGVNGNYKIGYGSPQEELCISIPRPPAFDLVTLQLSPHTDSRQEWYFKGFPLKGRGSCEKLFRPPGKGVKAP